VDFGSDALHRGTIGLPATPALFEHELGHTFGISHAGGLECEKTCVLDPYANPLDVMGDGTGDFGALQKADPFPQALVIHRGKVDLWIDHREAIGNDADLRTSIWRRVPAAVLVHETPANPTSIPFNQRKPDILLGNGGPRGQWLMHGKTSTIPHVLTITMLSHVGTAVTLRLRPLH
jgi:hypothetical protein